MLLPAKKIAVYGSLYIKKGTVNVQSSFHADSIKMIKYTSAVQAS